MDNEDFHFNKFLSDIGSSSRKCRCNALDNLKQFVGDDFSKLRTQCSDYINSLIKLFNDEAEICREKSMLLILSYIDSQNSIDEELFLSVSLIIERKIGGEIIEETSEEIRCMLLTTITSLISRTNDSVLNNHIEILIGVAKNSLKDSCSEVKYRGLNLVNTIVEKIPLMFRQYSDEITKYVLLCVKHKHSRIRCASIGTLKITLEYCSKDMILTICSSLGEGLLDENVHVRIAILRAAAQWMLSFSDRFKYAYCIIPLILSSLTDEIEACREEAFDLWDKIGLDYVEKNEEKITQGIDKGYLFENLHQLESNVQMPNIGCQKLVQNEIGKFLPAVIIELEDWKNEVRIKSIRLLHIVIIHAGRSIIPFLDMLMPILSKKCCDEESKICEMATKIAEIIGATVSPKIYWKFFVERFGYCQTLNDVILLSSLLKRSEDDEIFQLTPEITSVFMENQIHSNLQETNLQEFLLKILTKILHSSRDRKLQTSVVYDLYLILLSIMGSGGEIIEDEAFDLAEKLYLTSEFQSKSQLNENFFVELFPKILEDCSLWQIHSINFKMYTVLLKRFIGEIFLFVPEKFLYSLNVLLNPEFDKEVQFSVLLTVARLLDSDQINVNEHITITEKLVSGLVKRLLIWRSGRITEIIRNAALTVFDLYIRKVKILSSTFIEEFTPILISLFEDSYEDSRKMALSAIAYCCENHLRYREVKFNFFVKIFAAAVKRLEDQSHQVRMSAISSIKEILLITETVVIENDISEFEDFFQSMQLLILMSSDGNAEIRDAVQGLLQLQVVTDFLKQLCSEEKLAILNKKCVDESFANFLKKCWKI